MRGNVIGFDPDTNTGAISGYDGKRYDFVPRIGTDRPGRGTATSSIFKPMASAATISM